jgi:hypothetical protein
LLCEEGDEARGAAHMGLTRYASTQREPVPETHSMRKAIGLFGAQPGWLTISCTIGETSGVYSSSCVDVEGMGYQSTCALVRSLLDRSCPTLLGCAACTPCSDAGPDRVSRRCSLACTCSSVFKP